MSTVRYGDVVNSESLLTAEELEDKLRKNRLEAEKSQLETESTTTKNESK